MAKVGLKVEKKGSRSHTPNSIEVDQVSAGWWWCCWRKAWKGETWHNHFQWTVTYYGGADSFSKGIKSDSSDHEPTTPPLCLCHHAIFHPFFLSLFFLASATMVTFSTVRSWTHSHSWPFDVFPCSSSYYLVLLLFASFNPERTPCWDSWQSQQH